MSPHEAFALFYLIITIGTVLGFVAFDLKHPTPTLRSGWRGIPPKRRDPPEPPFSAFRENGRRSPHFAF